MECISFLLLMAPGILVWKLCDNTNSENEPSPVRTLLTILLDDFVILIAAYVILYVVYGRIPVSFDSSYRETIPTSIYSVSFVWKYGAVASGCAVALAIGKQLLRRWGRRK